MGELRNKNCAINDCSDSWNIKIKKIISEKQICVYDCFQDNIYIYEYKNKCYDDCPIGTIKSNINNMFNSMFRRFPF